MAFLSFVYVAVMVNQPVTGGLGYPTELPGMFSPLLPAEFVAAGPMGWMQLVFLGVLVFVGFDLPLVFENKGSRAVPAILLILAAFGLFVWAALLIKTPEELLDSTVPHLAVASQILEGKGRLLMGGTIVFATLAGLCALFRLFGHKVRGVLAEDYSNYCRRWCRCLFGCNHRHYAGQRLGREG